MSRADFKSREAAAAFAFVARHEALRTPEYLFEIDEYKRAKDGAQLLLAHIRVHTWTPAVFKRLFQEWKVFRNIVKAPLYACPEVADEKWHKFVTALGFEPIMADVPCENGDHRPLYIHTV